MKDGNATITLSPDGGGNYSAASIAAFKELIAKLQDDQCISAEYTVGSYMYDLDGLTFTAYGLLEKDGKTFVSELTVTGPGETPPPDPDPDKPPFPPAAPAGGGGKGRRHRLSQRPVRAGGPHHPGPGRPDAEEPVCRTGPLSRIYWCREELHMKTLVSLALALGLALSLPAAQAVEFEDFTDKDAVQYQEAVSVLNRLGIITGYADQTFRPHDGLSRGGGQNHRLPPAGQRRRQKPPRRGKPLSRRPGGSYLCRGHRILQGLRHHQRLRGRLFPPRRLPHRLHLCENAPGRAGLRQRPGGFHRRGLDPEHAPHRGDRRTLPGRGAGWEHPH